MLLSAVFVGVERVCFVDPRGGIHRLPDQFNAGGATARPAFWKGSLTSCILKYSHYRTLYFPATS